MAVNAFFEGVPEFLSALGKIATSADVAGERIVTLGGHAIEAATKNHMDGRPGPQRQSGTLSRSVRVVSVTRLRVGSWESRTGPTVIYGRRIELGFDGADSLCRVYHQPPYPSLQPGLEDAAPKLSAIYTAEWAKALRV